jgi:hypothetical protein
MTCFAVLLRDHAIEVHIAVTAARVLAALAVQEPLRWRDLPWLREQPLAAALAGCDKPSTQQLHTISEVLQFPKPGSLLLQRQLAVFRIRESSTADATGTAALVQTEPLLAPLLESLKKVTHQVWTRTPSGQRLECIPALWRGFFATPRTSMQRTPVAASLTTLRTARAAFSEAGGCCLSF